jgi:16S rRNA (cytosine967-C5)-methyltransferase
MRIYNDRLSFESLYPEILKDLDDRDKRRLINLVNQFFRHFSFVEKFLSAKIDKKIEDQELKTEMLILCAGVEYFFLDSSTDYSIVNEYVEMSKKILGQGKFKYINAILRRMTELEMTGDDKDSGLSLYSSHPDWITAKLVEQYGKETAEKILRFNQTIPPVYARANRLKNGRDELAAILKNEGVETAIVEDFADYLRIASGNAVASKAFEEGRFYIQDPPHSIPVLLLQPVKNDKILDLCCAPGVKVRSFRR